MKRRPKPQRRVRQRITRAVHRDRLRPVRVFRVRPAPGQPFVVEVRIARDRLRMFESIDFHDGSKARAETEREVAGMVRSWHGIRTRRDGIIRPRGIVARMYLNERDLRRSPSEIVAHESAHAGMAWSRIQRANLHYMAGEEVLCYAVGYLVAQINRICYAHGVWG